MDGFTGFKTATAEVLPDAVAVMDPFHVVRLAGDALDQCRRRVQQDLHGHRGRKDDPLYTSRRTLHTGADLLKRQAARPADRPVRGRRAHRGRGDLGHLPAHDWRLPRTRPQARARSDDDADRVRQPRGPGSADRAATARADIDDPRRRRPGILRPPLAPPTAPPKRSTDASNTSAAPPSGSATSPTTSPDHSWRAADSDPDYTVNCEEPQILRRGCGRRVDRSARESPGDRGVFPPREGAGRAFRTEKRDADDLA